MSTSGAYNLVGCERILDNCLFVARKFKMSVLLASYKDVELREASVPGLDTEGLYDEEGDAAFHYRWTNGNASIKVPSVAGLPPKRLDLGLHIPGSISVRILVNGAVLFAGILQPGEWRNSFPLPRLDSSNPIVIVLQSDTFVPGTSDRRSLGVKLVSLELH
jgi:hypothetical protein